MTSPTRALQVAVLALCLPTVAHAQRELHWDTLAVTAHLDAQGHLQIAETQTLVFTGDWNGGERKFNIRPRQKLSFMGIDRDTGATWHALTEDAGLDSVDDFAWVDRNTLRWRSRAASAPPFNGTSLRYRLRYVLSGILLKQADGYLLDHDFAFPDRLGTIDRFELRLTLDPAWQPTTAVQEVYTASGLPPGQSFVLTLPLRYTGTGSPAILDLTRPLEIRMAVSVLLGATVLAVLWFFRQEHSYGRFAPLDEGQVTEPWLREHILNHPAEVVGAAWDGKIGQPEVVALLARMTHDGTLQSEVSGEGKKSSITLRLKVDRTTLNGYERKLVDKLFYGGRTTTSTEEVKSHYKKEGFNPVSLIAKELEASVQAAFPFRDAPRKVRVETLLAFLFGFIMLVVAWSLGYVVGPVVFLLPIGSAIFAGIAAIPGMAFRARMDWGRGTALLCLIPALTIAAAAAAFLWFYAGTGRIELPTATLVSIVALALYMTNTSINSLRSRQKRAGIEERKRLAAARAFFVSELHKPAPALRDDWFPWVLAFGLVKHSDDWSARRSAVHRTDGGSFAGASGSSWSSASQTASQTWTGFGGGRSGGAGAGGSWAAAAGGLAAGVSPPSSSGSGGSSGGGGSRGGGSSGGGGGGGW